MLKQQHQQSYPNYIRYYCKQRGYSIQGLAEKIGLPRRTMTDYVTGVRPVPRHWLVKMARALSCPMKDLLPAIGESAIEGIATEVKAATTHVQQIRYRSIQSIENPFDSEQVISLNQLQSNAEAVNSLLFPIEGKVLSEGNLQLHHALSESIQASWKLLLSTSNAQMLALGQAQLLLLQQSHNLLYPLYRPFLYTGVYSLIGLALHFQVRDTEALQAHQNAYIAALSTGDPWYVAQSLICQSDCCRTLGQYDEAICLIKEALFVLSEPTVEMNLRAKAHLLTCWADNAMMLDDYKVAQEKLEMAASYLSQLTLNEEFDQAAWSLLAGQYDLITHNYKRAVCYFEEAFAQLPEQWILRRVMTAIGLSKAYARIRERDQSLMVAEQLIPMLRQVNAPMTNRWFAEYLQHDLPNAFPTDGPVKKFITQTNQKLPQITSIVSVR